MYLDSNSLLSSLHPPYFFYLFLRLFPLSPIKNKNITNTHHICKGGTTVNKDAIDPVPDKLTGVPDWSRKVIPDGN